MITRVKAVEILNGLIGIDLYEKAQSFGVTVQKGDKINKGWKGHTLELLAGLTNNSSRAPNGLDFELKSVAYIEKNGILIPKETMAITMINPSELEKYEFYESACWKKLKSIVFCACRWNGKHNICSELLKVTSFDFADSRLLLDEIKADYDFIRNKLITQGFDALTGRDGKWIQARTKGPGHGSKSRAFYARKSLLKEIINFT
ncbi:MAG TPA: MutH/Sau3AI family endonuclease [Ignavibacteria bacterium]|nr:MutH/Sau3AI family endonuclease [Ignavibacteria bacterium]